MNGDKLKNINWAIYARKSSESTERQIQSIDDQLKIQRDIAVKEGYKIVETIFESKSAKEPYVRDGFNRLMELVESGKINGILVWKLDRLSRNPVDSGKLQYLLQKKKILCIKTFEKNYLPEDNALLMSVETGMSNQYLRDLSVNVKRGITKKCESGWFPTIPPLGYLNSKVEDKGKQYIKVDERLFPVVKKMWQYMLTGNYTVPAIHQLAINDWGLITPTRKKLGGRPMALSHMYKIFTNIFYTGDFVYDGVFYKGKHSPMVTQDEFDRVQVIMGKRGKPRPKNHVFAYTGICRCAECNSMVTASEKTKLIKTTGEVKIFTYYHCTKRKVNSHCKNVPVRVEDLENNVTEILSEFTIDPDFYKLGLEVLKEMHGKEATDAHRIYENQNQIKEELLKKRTNATQYLLNGTISESEFRKIKAELDEQIEKQTNKVSDFEGKVKKLNELTEDAFHFLKLAREIFMDKNSDLQIKKEIFSSLGWNYKLKDKKVLIDMHSWANVLKRGEKTLLPQIKALELMKNPLTAKNLQKRELLFSSLRSGRDSNPRTGLTPSTV